MALKHNKALSSTHSLSTIPFVKIYKPLQVPSRTHHHPTDRVCVLLRPLSRVFQLDTSQRRALQVQQTHHQVITNPIKEPVSPQYHASNNPPPRPSRLRQRNSRLPSHNNLQPPPPLRRRLAALPSQSPYPRRLFLPHQRLRIPLIPNSPPLAHPGLWGTLDGTRASPFSALCLRQSECKYAV